MFKKITLDNGLRIITAPQPGNLAVTVLVLVEAGSQYETKDTNGLSHFLEHMCFKGTKKRPTALQISSELDEMGGSHSAFTGHEYTGYYVKAESKNLDKIMDIISDMYLNPLFDAKEIDREKGVIIEEINMNEDDPQRDIWDVFTKLLYGDQPSGWNIAGPRENIRKLTREDFISYRDKHYLADSTIVVVAGSFDEKEVVGKVSAAFKDIPKNEKGGRPRTLEAQKKPEVSIKHKASDQIHTILGFRTFDIFDKRRYALEVMSAVLGAGMSSRLFHKVRERLGAAYYVRAGNDFYTDHGYFAIAAGLNKEKLEAALTAMLDELGRIKEELVPASELNKVKNHIAGNLVLGLETSNAVASFYGDQEVLEKKIVTPHELLKRINAVTAEDVRNVARAIIKNEGMNLATIGPVEDKGKLETILKID